MGLVEERIVIMTSSVASESAFSVQAVSAG
jgi:hypothetical protein